MKVQEVGLGSGGEDVFDGFFFLMLQLERVVGSGDKSHLRACFQVGLSS
jgi:hypothetical protein